MKALVIDYGVGNIFSISSALRRVGFDVAVGRAVKPNYDLIVFPGVGNFASVSRFIRLNAEILNDVMKSGTPFLGICIGMHVMLEYSFEGGFNKGLGWINGFVDKIKADVKLPHIGWDKIYAIHGSDFEFLNEQYVYFMHSYVAYTTEKCEVFGHYGIKFPAVLRRGAVIGTQFHPEKSSSIGTKFLNTLTRWLRC